MPRPKIRLICCLCGKRIGQRVDVVPLDIEWQRRYPRMVGTLACRRCALRDEWRCDGPDGRYVEGHIPSAVSLGPCLDSWDHIGDDHSLVAAVISHPRSALEQGAEEYLRYTAHRPGVDAEVVRELQAALAGWDAEVDLHWRLEDQVLRPSDPEEPGTATPPGDHDQ